MPTPHEAPKYKQVLDALRRDILEGRLRRGDRVPSEAALVTQFGTSRITVGRALRELQAAGLVERRVGSGTYVRGRNGGRRARLFGALVPEMHDTDIFGAVVHGLTNAGVAQHHTILWGGDAPEGSADIAAWEVCRRYIEQRVDGVFFAPLEGGAAGAGVNRRIVSALAAARIPVVLLDRPVAPYPQPSAHDVVGIDNRRAGHVVAGHLVAHGCRRLAFVAVPRSAATVDAREAGFREAVHATGIAADARAFRLDPSDAAAVRDVLDRGCPDAIVCANDRTAARLMHTLIGLGCAIPRDVCLAAVDDTEYAALLPVPLTTLRQPAAEIGAAALAAMLERIDHPALPARDIFLHAALVERRSCADRP
jgi:DNA-binding LacI/PurR family transcriptional regulator